MAPVSRPTRAFGPNGDARCVAGRYRVEAELARGGMGTVYAVLDESTGAKLALKRLGSTRRGGTTRRKGSPAEADAALLFQLEYAMLSRLRHPSIIDVYEYGIDDGTPYYTMELLDGQDLREVAPAPYREACRHARDVASSLALLHAHRLVHRDVSPRNVRVTAGGRSKLFDFGTLTPFGVPADIAGTPSCVPPEALNGSALDHRADLYSLGCVLYWLLTAREAFPARRLDDLPALLEGIPPPPSTTVRDVPEELDALVMSMLSRDPLARPSSAAEVIERLDAAARLDPEERGDVAHGYVLSAKTVGRAVEVAALGQCIERALSAEGGGMLVLGERGLGKTRLVREAALQGQLRGATVLVVDASLHDGPYATAAALGRRLLQASPLEAAASGSRHASFVCHVVPELSDRLGRVEVAQAPDAPGEWRARLQGALRAWLLDFAERRPLVLIVDDLDRADESSAGLILSLAREGPGRRLVVIGTARESGAAQRLSAAFGTRIVLRPLGPEAVSELAHSLFGDAPHMRRFARRLHERSGGSPASCMDLVRHLVENQIIRYADGVWTLPEEASIGALSASLEEAVAARLSRLRPAARSLAEALSVASTALPLGLFLRIARADVATEQQAVAELDELVTEGILIGSDGQYRFADELLRGALVGALDEDRSRRLHRQLGEALVLGGEGRAFESITAGWHLLRGGDEQRGAELLASAGRRLILETDDLKAAVAPLEAALAVYRRSGRPAHELVSLVGPLASAGYFVDRRLAVRYGAEALSLFRQATGLARAAELEPVLGRRAALGIGVATATMSRRLASAEAEPTSTRELFELFFRCAMTLSGVASVCVDAPGVQRVADALEPLSQLGVGHAATWLYRYSVHLREVCEGRFEAAHRGLLEILTELQGGTRRTAFPERARRLLIGGALYALGAMESFRDGDDALIYASRLNELDLRLYDMVADQLRMLYHAHRGEAEEARRFRDRVDGHAIARGMAWQIEVWEPPAMLLVHLRESNVMGLKLTAERLERLSVEIPSLERFARIARGAHLRLRGDLHRAEVLLESVARPGQAPFAGRTTAVAALAEIYNARGDHVRAEAITRDVLAQIGGARRSFSRMSSLAQIQHAHALAGLGALSAARQELDEMLEEHAAGRGPLTLGLVHRAHAQLALLRGDTAEFDAHLGAMERSLRPTNNPALVSMCERLRHEFRRGRTAASGEYRMQPEGDVTTSRRSAG